MIKKNKDNSYKVYCPICDYWFDGSEYLMTIFENNDYMLWFANMVTHYRHTHITSWNKCWGYHGDYYRKKWFKDYNSEKEKVNERAKRQIIRKCRSFMQNNGFTLKNLGELVTVKEETLKVAMKLL